MNLLKSNIPEEKIEDVREKLGVKAAKLLERFYVSGIQCWLDSGSLLGMVRNNKLNDWEKDIDLGIWIEDYSEAVRLSYLFAKEEKVKFKIKFLRGIPYKLSYNDAENNSDEQLPFDIHIFYKIDGFAWSAQSSSLLKKEPNIPSSTYKSFLSEEKGKRFSFLKFFVRYPKYALCILIKKMQFHHLLQFAMNVNWRLHYFFNPTFHQGDSVIFGMFFELYEWKVPHHFFNDSGPLPNRAPHLLAPMPVEDYLALRYGKDWRKPNSNWFYIFHDGCIFPSNEDDYNRALSIYRNMITI